VIFGRAGDNQDFGLSELMLVIGRYQLNAPVFFGDLLQEWKASGLEI
jgi:hypothetical protein